MAILLPDLPFAKDALTPHISANTLDYHYGKHHNAYITNLNNLVTGSDLENDELETIIKKTSGVADKVGVFNNAAQVWNHTFYWNSMKANGGGLPSGNVADLINGTFGSFENFVSEFKQAGVTQFGSGWAWLILENGQLKITKTANADTPIAHRQTPLLAIDVWEHAYYLDYQNRRPDYLAVFIKHLINWDFINSHLS